MYSWFLVEKKENILPNCPRVKPLHAIFGFKSCWLVWEHSSIAACCEVSPVCVLRQLQSKSVMQVHNEQLLKSVLNTSACMLQMLFKIGVRYRQILRQGNPVPVLTAVCHEKGFMCRTKVGIFQL